MSKLRIKYNTESLKKLLPELECSQVEIYFDTENEEQLQEIATVFHKAGERKVKRALAVILKNDYHDQVYKKKKGDLAVIKLAIGEQKQEIHHIYCSEVFENGRKTVSIRYCLRKK